MERIGDFVFDLTCKISFEIKPLNSLNNQSPKLTWLLFEITWGIISESSKITYIMIQKGSFFYGWFAGESYTHLDVWSAASTEELKWCVSDASGWASDVRTSPLLGELHIMWMTRPLPGGSAQVGKLWDCGRAVCTFNLGDVGMQFGVGITMLCFHCKFVSFFLHSTWSLYISIISG